MSELAVEMEAESSFAGPEPLPSPGFFLCPAHVEGVPAHPHYHTQPGVGKCATLAVSREVPGGVLDTRNSF